MNKKLNSSYSQRLHHVIPGGAHTYSRGDDQFPDNAPQIIERASGAYVYDPDNNKYLDYGMGLRSVTIGYCDSQINAAVCKQIEKGVNFTRPGVKELEAAELLASLHQKDCMVKFAKNGSNVTTAALKIARAYTGRKYVCIPKQHPFFSFDDWFIGTTELKRGIPEEHYSLTLVFDYNDIESLKELFDRYKDQIAAVMLEPLTTIVPCPISCCQYLTNGNYQKTACSLCKNNFLVKVRDLAHKNGAIFILDEMISGFRFGCPSAQTFFGVRADITTYGKGMANGYPLSAMVGDRELMQVGSIDKLGMERTFLLSTTHGAEMLALAAFTETIKVYNDRKVIDHFWQYGEKLFKEVNKISSNMGLSEYFGMEGGSIIMNYYTRDNQKKPSLVFRTLFAREMLKRGILMPYISFSYAHQSQELSKTLDAISEALIIYKQALEGDISRFLPCPEIRPVFRKYN